MSFRKGRGQPIICSAVLTTFCRAFLSAAEQPLYHSEMHYVSRLSMVASRRTPTSSSLCHSSWAVWESRVSVVLSWWWQRCWQTRRGPQRWEVPGIWRTLLSPCWLHWCRAGLGWRCISSWSLWWTFSVFVVFSERLFTEYHATWCFISSLYAVSSPPEMSPMTVMSSANLMKDWCAVVGVQGVEHWALRHARA